MNTIYVLAADGTHAPFEERMVRSMLEQGSLSPSTLYWKEGMAEWRPLSEWHSPLPAIAPAAALATAPGTPVGGRYAFVKNPNFLTNALAVLLIILAGIDLLDVLAQGGLLFLINTDNLTESNASISDSVSGGIAIVHLIFFVVIVVVFSKWIYRANLNCRGFGATSLEYTPGWAVGYYFIPILCLFRPYRAMKEIWQASTDPHDWERQPGSALLNWWWGLWIVGNFLGQISFRLQLHVTDVPSLTNSTWAYLAESVFDIALCIVAAVMVRTLVARQNRLVES